MPKFGTFIWKSTPMLRLLLPLATGILLQQYFSFSMQYVAVFFLFGIFVLTAFLVLKPAKKFVWSWLSGLSLNLLLMCIGSGLVFAKNMANQTQWIGNYMNQSNVIFLTLKEPLTEKAKSYKALAKADFVFINKEWKSVKGDVLVYFKKDSVKSNLQNGSQIIINKQLQPISNSGNPASFNYQRYCAFQDIYAQTFLQTKDYLRVANDNHFSFDRYLINARTKVLSILRKNIANADELSIAEALLIGYRDDLDKDLVQAYSNTGVVHIIAISGLHIAMIYGLIVLLFKPLQRFNWIKFIKPIVILLVIWGFTFLAGAAPSILRSAVMFTFIVIGENLGKRINIYNNLAASAFTILLFNPYSLWDVGFQLSYAAVLSIVVFSKHIEHWFYFKNKLLKMLWQLNAVTLSAQILTLPIILYNFHQFPNFFLFTNLFAVPFSGIILYAEIFLLVVSPFSTVAEYVGKFTGWCIGFMNDFIERINNIPFSAWQNIQISALQEIVLYAAIVAFAWWLMHKQIRGFITALACLTLFAAMRSIDFIQRNRQQKLIVYNIPQHRAIDIVDGRDYQFAGDSILLEDGFLRNFHLKPSRILHRISLADSLTGIDFHNNIVVSSNKNIVLIDQPVFTASTIKKIKVDAIIISKNPKLYINQLAQIFDCDEYIFDASNPVWKINKWKKDCENLHLRHYSILEQGAFVMDL